MGNFVIWIGKIHGLFAVVGNGYRRSQDIDIAVAQCGEQTVPRLMFKLNFEITRLSHGIDQIDIKALDVVCTVHKFKRRKFGIHGNTVNLLATLRTRRSRFLTLALTLTTAGSQ